MSRDTVAFPFWIGLVSHRQKLFPQSCLEIWFTVWSKFMTTPRSLACLVVLSFIFLSDLPHPNMSWLLSARAPNRLNWKRVCHLRNYSNVVFWLVSVIRARESTETERLYVVVLHVQHSAVHLQQIKSSEYRRGTKLLPLNHIYHLFVGFLFFGVVLPSSRVSLKTHLP